MSRNYFKSCQAIKRFFILFCFFFLFSFLASPVLVLADSTALIMDNATSEVGNNFKLDINLQSGGINICSVRADLSFPSDLLEVVNLLHNSVFSVETIKKYSNQDGTVSYSLGSQNCTKNNSNVYTVEFKAKNAGSGQVNFSKIIVGTVDNTGMPKAVDNVRVQYASISIGGGNSPNTIPNDQPQDSSITNSNGFKTNHNSNQSANSNSSSVINASTENTNNGQLKTPNLQRVEYGQNSELDKKGKRVKGIKFYGTADPNAKINITIGKNIKISTTANGNGQWEASYDDWLKDGVHVFSAISQLEGKNSSELLTTFTVNSGAEKKVSLGVTVQKPEIPQKKNYWTIILVSTGAAILLAFLIYLLIKKYKKRKK